AEVGGKKLSALNLAGFTGDLLVEKTAAVREGRSERESATTVIGRHGHPEMHLTLEVRPLRDTNRRLGGLLYLARDITRFRELEKELSRAHEERKSALEELQTVNEEMQSSNEELETTNEELQSANEELQITNEEL